MAILVLSILVAAAASAAIILWRRPDWRSVAPLLLTLSLPLLVWAIAFSLLAAPHLFGRMIGHPIDVQTTRQLDGGGTVIEGWDEAVWFPKFREAAAISIVFGAVWSLYNLIVGRSRIYASLAMAVAFGWAIFFVYVELQTLFP